MWTRWRQTRRSGAWTVASVAAALVVACRPAAPGPSELDVRRAVDADLWRYGEPVDFVVVSRDAPAQSVQQLHFRAAVRLTEACYWTSAGDGPGELRKAEELGAEERRLVQEGAALPPELVPLPAGALYVIEGSVRFDRVQEGWTLRPWSPGRRGYCIEDDPGSCYQRHGLDRPDTRE